MIKALLVALLCQMAAPAGPAGVNDKAFTWFSRPEINPQPFLTKRFTSVKITEGVKFAEVTDYRGKRISLLLDVYEPEGDKSALRPVIIWVHGGGFRTGSVRTQGYIVRYCNAFARRGYVCLSVDYRLREGKDMPDRKAEMPALKDAARDVNTAIEWVRQNGNKFRISRELVFLAGGSAGGRAAITAAAFTGPDHEAVNTPESLFRDRQWNKEGIIATAALWGAPEPEMRDWVYPYLDKTSIPAVLIHGDADSVIGVQNSIDLAEAMKKAGAEAELHIMKGKPHTPAGKETDSLIENWIARFFVRQWEAPFQDGFASGKSVKEAIAKNRMGEITVKARPGDRISVEQLRHEFWFGCAISNGLGSGKMNENDLKQYKEKFLMNFNSAVTENAVKWGTMEPRKGEVDYSIIDNILAWCYENDLPLRGHNIFWGIPQFIQPWVKELDDSELRETLKNRAETLGSRYKGRFAEYDLNNEMIHGNYYEDRLGPDITRLMAEWVHNGDPGARLWLNDYDILTGNRLADYMAHIRKLLRQGVPVAGIGAQGHLHAETFDRFALQNALDSLAVFGLPVRITEFNMPGQRSVFYEKRITSMTREEEMQKAKELTDYYRICFAHPAVEGILMWGFWEGANWIPVSSLYKRDWTATPAADAYRDLVFGEWRTRTGGTANSDGTFTSSAFYGKYRVTVNGVSREVYLSRSAGKAVVTF